MDQGIICCFKAQYCARYIECAIDCYSSDITPSAIYDINQLEAMHLADAAWYKVGTDTIQHCWHKSGLLPESAFSLTHPAPSIPISALLNNMDVKDPLKNAESHVEKALNTLVATGALQTQNRLCIKDLLNPEIESVVFTGTDEDIYNSVKKSIKSCDQAESNGGDNNSEDDAIIEPSPSHHDALMAASVLTSFTCNLNDPLAHRLEDIPASFKCQVHLQEMQSKHATRITDYFSSM
jgi:hypothetical protein